MRLGSLIGGDLNSSVTGFAIDHRKVAPGTVFGAFRGARFNGEDFIADAVSAGAVGDRGPAGSGGKGRGPCRRRRAPARIRAARGTIL